MKSPVNKSGKETLDFRWDRQAAKNNPKTGDLNACDFDAYFAFLEEVKPHPHELREITTYKSPFRLD
jgi:hypothetical protein